MSGDKEKETPKHAAHLKEIPAKMPVPKPLKAANPFWEFYTSRVPPTSRNLRPENPNSRNRSEKSNSTSILVPVRPDPPNLPRFPKRKPLPAPEILP